MTNFVTPPQDAAFSYESAQPHALLIAEHDADCDAAQDALDLAGFHTRRRIGFADAAQDLSNYEGVDLIVIEAARAPEALLDVVLARADTVARERARGVIATILPEQIDAAASQLTGPRVQLLCDPRPSERLSAVALSKWQQSGMFSDVTRDPEAVRLRRLNEEVARIAETLARLTRAEDGERRAGVREGGQEYRGSDQDKADPSAQEIRAVIRSRRMRGQFFMDGLFADPAWDMLLDLFAAELERRRVSVSSLCIAAAVPPTTALRWIGTLHDAGLFERHADPSDRRRAYIALSQKALDGMRSYAGAVKRAGLSLV